MNTIIMILVALLIFGLVILFHEFGHFITAKKAGIKVNEFAIGMGPTLFKFQKGETKYAIRALPIGGFVSMEGEDEESDNERSFTKAPLPKRLLVIISGAFMNLVLGFLAIVVLVSFQSKYISSRVVAEVYNENSQFMEGDKLLKVNGRRCFTTTDISYELSRGKNGEFEFVVLRGGEKVTLNDIQFEEVVATDQNTGEVIIDDNTGEAYTYLSTGFYIMPVNKNFFSVIKESFFTTISYGRMIYVSLGDLITGKEAINQLSGPVGIVSEIGKAISLGWINVVNILAIISVNLGIMNMLPFPALDGGKTLLIIIEAIRRKPINQKYEIALNFIGFAILMALMIFVSFNDIRKLVMR